ncbi:MAG: Rrf2 family transcriptional regulator [Bacteroidales bacterium]|nr:Rrf2 family transcriptional regulator [Bacteroidales bacterium]
MVSKKTQYALYALRYLAMHYNKGPILIKEIVREEKLPRKFIENILLELKNSGYVNSKKGKKGGYYLIKKPEEINFADILRLFEGAIALLPCATYKYFEDCTKCDDINKCGLRIVVKAIRDETVSILKSKTLKDVVDLDKSGRYKENEK